METTLHFEHDNGEEGGKRASPIWVTRILLGRLFIQRKALGQVVKLYSRFQRREIMRCMVKINDLEEEAEPPLSGMMDSSTSSTSKGDAMDVEESVGL